MTGRLEKNSVQTFSQTVCYGDQPKIIYDFLGLILRPFFFITLNKNKKVPQKQSDDLFLAYLILFKTSGGGG